jgi:hypothetical protein
MRRWRRAFYPAVLAPAVLAALCLIALLLLLGSAGADTQDTLHGVVMTAAGPVAGASVRLRATDNSALTGADGSFTLSGVTTGITIPVTAWYPGYYVTETQVVLPSAAITLTLIPYTDGDNPDYAWLFAHRADSPPQEDYGCDNCHAAPVVAQWENNAHARSAISPRFLSLYNGSDITGTKVISPGYRLDFPGTAGNCATCHAPGAAVDAPFSTDMNGLAPPEADGVFCDFCHKTAGIYLNPATGLPYPNSPGVLSHDLRRPAGDQQLFFGPYDDVPEPDTFLPMMKQSQFCAACHNFSFWGTPIYQSFAEWLASPYADEGVHCQACHMAPDGVTTNFAPGAGGFERDPMSIPSHTQPGASDLSLLQNTVTMTLSVRQEIGRLFATVAITNTGAGHHVPTDHPGRHMILTVQAVGAQSQRLGQQSGAVVPGWGGAQAGLPGTVYAKVLRDVQSGRAPVVSYWKQTFIESDNRIPARESDLTVYAFAIPETGQPVTVTAELRFRRVFHDVMDARGWTAPDVVMAEAETAFVARPYRELFLPLIWR